MSQTTWRYEASARGPRAVIVLGLWWGFVVFGLLVIDLSPWIAALLLAVSLPAAWELLRGSRAWLEIGPEAISWGSGKRMGSVTRDEFDKVRLDTRLDFSLRMTLILVSGKKVRLPYECLPRAARLKEALDAAGIAHEHHHFALLS